MGIRLRGHLLLELFYHLRQQPQITSLVDSGTLRFWQPLGPLDREGVWVQEARILSAGSSLRLELDLLPREVFGRLIYLGFGRVKLLWLVNRGESEGLLQIGPAAEQGWLGPWTPDAKVTVPPGNPLVCSSLAEGWPVTPENLALELTALHGNVHFDLLLLGQLIEFGGGESGGPPPDPSESSNSSSSDPDSSRSESSEEASSENAGSSEGSSEDSSEWSSSGYEESSWS
jgi:hypothetical protein